MGRVRKRGKFWNAQVKIAGWKNFTKFIKVESHFICWILQTEYQLKNISPPLVSVGEKSLKVLFQAFAEKVTAHLNDPEIETYKLNLYSKHQIAENKLFNLAQRYFEHLQNEIKTVLRESFQVTTKS